MEPGLSLAYAITKRAKPLMMLMHAVGLIKWQVYVSPSRKSPEKAQSFHFHFPFPFSFPDRYTRGNRDCRTTV